MKKKKINSQISDIQGKRGNGIFCHEQCGQVPRTFGSVLSHSNHGNSLGFSHIWFPQKDLCRKKKIIRVDRVTILRGFLLTLIEIITKYVRETLFSTLAFDLEPLVYQLPLTKSSIFTKSYISIKAIYIPIFLSSGHKIYYARHYQQFLVSIYQKVLLEL